MSHFNRISRAAYTAIVFLLCAVLMHTSAHSAITPVTGKVITANSSPGVGQSNALVTNAMLSGGGAQKLGLPVVKIKGSNKGMYVEGELLVKLKPTVSVSRLKKMHEKYNSQVVKEFKSFHIQHVKLKPGLGAKEAIALYNSDPDVEYAEPNYIVTSQRTPNDPFFLSQWGLDNAGRLGGTSSGADIKAPAAWDITTGNSNVIVAVLDTGVDYTHEDLSANMWVNPGEIAGNGIDDEGNGYVDDVYGIDTLSHDSNPMDDNGHGTHVAGIIGAAGNNGTGVVGVNWQVRIIPCKFLDATGSGTDSGAIECLQYIKALQTSGANIVATNNSWGCNGCYSQALYDAINSQREILFSAAAGNDSRDNDPGSFYPASFSLPNVISVAATEGHDNLASFSNYGRRSVHVSAPGDFIYSTLPTQNIWGITGGYGPLSGTSMAAPYVAGLAALVKSQNPGMDWRGIKNLILAGGDTLPSLDGKTITGKRLNAYGSLTCSDKPVFSVLNLPFPITVGVPLALSALSINCASPVGAISVTSSSGDILSLHDDGIGLDLAAGDGIFTATYIPTQAAERLIFTFTSMFGTKTETVFTAPLSLDLEALNCTLGQAYSHFLKSHGGSAPYQWSITSGSLPPGLALDAATGEIYGTASHPGVYTFSARVTESLADTVVEIFSIRVIDDSLPEQWRVSSPSRYGGGRSVAVDVSGNVYVTGAQYSYDENFSYVKSINMSTIKYDSSGNVLWEAPYIEADYNWPNAITVDGGGNVYVVGVGLVGNVPHGTIFKLDPSGNILWSKTDFIGDGCASGVALDKNGYVYVSGALQCYSAAIFGVVKFDPSGNIMWSKTYDDPLHNNFPGGGIAIDGTGNIVLAGYSFEDNGNFRHLTVKFDPSGNVLWADKSDLGYSFQQLGKGVAADKSGNTYVLRQSVGNPNWHSLIVKLDPAGVPLWSVPYYGYSANGIVVDASGAVYVTGSGFIFDNTKQAYNQLYLTIKYDKSGNVVWTKSSDGWLPLGVELDGNGAVYVTGYDLGDVAGTAVWLTIKYQEPLANLSLTMTDNSDPILLNKNIVFTMTVHNTGPETATGVMLTDTIPPGTSFVSAVTSQGSCSGANTVGCALDPIITGTSATVTLTVKATTPGIKTNTASVSAFQYDPDFTNNNATGTTSVNPANLSVRLTASPTSVSQGGKVTYALSVTNNGPSPATGVTVTGTLPTCNPGNIAAGATATCPTVSVTATTVGTLTQTMAVSGIEPDPVPGNNTKSVSTPVKAAADLTPTALRASRSGTKVSVSDTARNQGSSKITTAFTVGYYLSTDKVYQFGTDLALASGSNGSGTCKRSIASLSAGSSNSGSKTCYKPTAAKTGVNYHILVVDDAGNVITESKETNNTRSTTGTVRW